MWDVRVNLQLTLTYVAMLCFVLKLHASLTLQSLLWEVIKFLVKCEGSLCNGLQVNVCVCGGGGGGGGLVFWNQLKVTMRSGQPVWLAGRACPLLPHTTTPVGTLLRRDQKSPASRSGWLNWLGALHPLPITCWGFLQECAYVQLGWLPSVHNAHMRTHPPTYAHAHVHPPTHTCMHTHLIFRVIVLF